MFSFIQMLTSSIVNLQSYASNFMWIRDFPVFMSNYSQWIIAPALAYPFLVHYGQGQFNMGLKMPLFLWNSTLAIYSAVSFVALTPHVMGTVIKHGYHESVCQNRKEESYLFQPWGFWIFLAVLSKVVELGDTAFLVLRGRTVNFLHWYHHIVTLTIAVIEGVTFSETPVWAIYMNLLVHTWMYAHYAISTYLPIRGNKILTLLQILQMIHGVFYTSYHAIFCNGQKDFAAITVYTIYMYLFLSFFNKKYAPKTRSKDYKSQLRYGVKNE